MYHDPSADVNGSAQQANITDIACPSGSLCLAVDANGFALASTTPTAGGSWKRYAIDPGFFAQPGEGQLDAVACPSVSECVAFDYVDYRLWVTADPIAGTWTAVQLPQHDVSNDSFTVDNEPQFTAATCGATASCVAFNNSGAEVTSTTLANPASWRALPRPNVVLGHDPDTGAAIIPAILRCPSATMCVAAGVHTSNVATTTNADGGGAAWQVTRLYPGANIEGNPNDGPLEPSLACAGPSFCIAYDDRPLSEQALVWALTGYRGHPAWGRTNIRIRADQDGTDFAAQGRVPVEQRVRVYRQPGLRVPGDTARAGALRRAEAQEPDCGGGAEGARTLALRARQDHRASQRPGPLAAPEDRVAASRRCHGLDRSRLSRCSSAPGWRHGARGGRQSRGTQICTYMQRIQHGDKCRRFETDR